MFGGPPFYLAGAKDQSVSSSNGRSLAHSYLHQAPLLCCNHAVERVTSKAAGYDCVINATLLDNSFQSFFLGPSRKCSCNTLWPTYFVKQRGSAILTRLARQQHGLPRSRLKDCSIALDSYRTPERCHCPRHRCFTRHSYQVDVRNQKHLLASNHDNVGFKVQESPLPADTARWSIAPARWRLEKHLNRSSLAVQATARESTTSLKTPR